MEVQQFSMSNNFIKISEQDSLYNDLEKMSVKELLENINNEDRKVASAVEKTIPQIGFS